MPFDPYSTGVLKKEHHERLVADIEGYAQDAGIPAHWIYTQLPPSVSETERTYLRDFKKIRTDGVIFGLAYVGKEWGAKVSNRMSLVTGCLVRNFVRARMMTLGQVIDFAAGQENPDLSCVLIPNFFIPSQDAGTVASWQINSLLDFLMARRIHGQQTVLYVEDMDKLRKEYGASFTEIIQNNFVKVRA